MRPQPAYRYNPKSSRAGETQCTLLSHLQPGETDDEEGMESVRSFLRSLQTLVEGRVQLTRAPIVSNASPVGLLAAAAHNQVQIGEYRTRFVLNGREIDA